MIAPATRLILILSAGLLPLTLVAAWVPALAPAAYSAFFLTAVAAILDGAAAGHRLEGVTVTSEKVARMTVDRPAGLRLVIGKKKRSVLGLRAALVLPRNVLVADEAMDITLNADEDAVSVSWPCRALRRGEYVLTHCCVETSSWAGLWNVRQCMELHTVIRAYPNLVGGKEDLKGLFRRREWGQHPQRRVGKGREFEQLRDYLPGDSFEDIDWKATARWLRPVTRTYQVEQAQEIYLVLDGSRLSTRSAAYVIDRRRRTRDDAHRFEVTVFDRYVTAALVMAVVADRLTDRFGLLVFSDKLDAFLKAGRGKAHHNACRDALFKRMPRPVAPDFDEVFTFVGTRLRKRALLVFLTSLDDPVAAEGFVRATTTVARQHVVLANMLRPPGAHPLFSSGDIHDVYGIYQHLLGHMLWESLSETRRRLRQRGVGFGLLDQEQLCSQLVSQYLDIKQRQVL